MWKSHLVLLINLEITAEVKKGRKERKEGVLAVQWENFMGIATLYAHLNAISPHFVIVQLATSFSAFFFFSLLELRIE